MPSGLLLKLFPFIWYFGDLKVPKRAIPSLKISKDGDGSLEVCTEGDLTSYLHSTFWSVYIFFCEWTTFIMFKLKKKLIYLYTPF